MAKKKRLKKKVQMHVISFHISAVDGYERPDDAFGKRFFHANVVHNIMVKEAMRRMDAIRNNKQYQMTKHTYSRLKHLDENDERLPQLADQLSSLQKEYGLSKASFESYLKLAGRKYKCSLSSQQVQKEADRVWQAVSKVLFSNGKSIHFRKYNEVLSISQKCASNGIKANLRTGECQWNGLHFQADIDWNDPYVTDALLSKVCYYEIKRMMFPSGWRYYLTVVLHDNAPKKINDIDRAKQGTGGIDPGPSTIAFVSDDYVLLTRLSPDADKYERQIRHLQNVADRLIRTANPDNYNCDGTVKKGRHVWHISHRVQRLRRMITSLHRKKSAYVRQNHYQIANQIVRHCVELNIEPTNFKGMQHRTQQTTRSDKLSMIHKKDGSLLPVHKYKRKKRFGHSLNLHAPAEMITILEQKCEQYNIPVNGVNPYLLKASQYNPITGEYESSNLNIRIKHIDGHDVQRDLLSAYIIANTDPTYTAPDTEKCIRKWNNFLQMHDNEIKRLKAAHISFKQCFGF